MDFFEPANNSTHAPTSAPGAPYPVWVGYVCALIAVILYGSNFVPVKKYFTGDGMFFQWILCSSILLTGIVVQLIMNSKFYPFVMLGGAVWAVGNVCVVPIFKTIGMALGMSIWGSIALVTGWACGRFGLFDTTPAPISHKIMNYVGVSLSFASVFIFSCVKNEISGSTDMEIVITSEEEPLLTEAASINESHSTPVLMPSGNGAGDILVFNAGGKRENGNNTVQAYDEEEKDDETFLDRLSPMNKRIVGIALSVASGFMYGVNFMPATYIQDEDHGKTHPQNGLNYVFAQFCGTYLASSAFFIIYCIVKKNKPKVYPQVIFPGILSGTMWSIATVCWFIANTELSQAISFPIVASGPSGIASLFWGVFIFGEIKGMKNILILVLAFSVMTTGAILAGFSR